MILEEGLPEEGAFSINTLSDSKIPLQIDQFDLLIVLVSDSFCHSHPGSTIVVLKDLKS